MLISIVDRVRSKRETCVTSPLRTLRSRRGTLGSSYLNISVPYKMLEDFKNVSYRVDLPRHLKRQSVHDSFHVSLLRIHLPNDDRLFPGWLDTQLGNQDTPDGEWAVERIERYVGSKADAKFQVKWKSGDVTWIPYYQVQHLDALEAYLKLQGVGKIQDLPAGMVSSNSQARTKPPISRNHHSTKTSSSTLEPVHQIIAANSIAVVSVSDKKSGHQVQTRKASSKEFGHQVQT
jgi:hypothetical protein